MRTLFVLSLLALVLMLASPAYADQITVRVTPTFDPRPPLRGVFFDTEVPDLTGRVLTGQAWSLDIVFPEPILRQGLLAGDSQLMIGLSVQTTPGATDNTPQSFEQRGGFLVAPSGAPAHAPIGVVRVWNPERFAPMIGVPLEPFGVTDDIQGAHMDLDVPTTGSTVIATHLRVWAGPRCQSIPSPGVCEGGTGSAFIDFPQPVPEPMTLLLVIAGIAAIGTMTGRRARRP
jgi:hypothetical protein